MRHACCGVGAIGDAAYAECDGRIERPPEPALLLLLVAQGQQRAASQLLLAPLATVGDVPSGGKPLSELRNLGGTLTERTLTDPLPLGPFLGLRHGAPAARHRTLWGVAHGGGTTWPQE